VDTDGIKHVLGVWIQSAEGSSGCTCSPSYANRRIKDVLIACCDGLEGLPEAIETVWPNAVTQTCVVHLIRACMRYVAYGDRKATAALLRPIYTAASEQAALDALDALATFADSNIGKRHPGAATRRSYPPRPAAWLVTNASTVTLTRLQLELQRAPACGLDRHAATPPPGPPTRCPSAHPPLPPSFVRTRVEAVFDTWRGVHPGPAAHRPAAGRSATPRPRRRPHRRRRPGASSSSPPAPTVTSSRPRSTRQRARAAERMFTARGASNASTPTAQQPA
jgi:hypothetical protein